MSLLEAKGLAKAYKKRRVVNGVTISVSPGEVVGLLGPNGAGKTTLATHVVAEAQRNGGICAYIDAEHAMDPTYARAIGVDVDELLISQPDTGEQALEIAEKTRGPDHPRTQAYREYYWGDDE